MKYDPIKNTLGRIFNSTPFLRRVFYHLLNIFLLRTWHVKQEIKFWAANQKSAVSILDAGCGFGQYTFYLSGFRKNWHIKAVDINPEQLDDCRNFFKTIKRSNAEFEVADLTLFSESTKYNLIVSVDVMEHIEDDVAVFRNFYNALLPGGMLLVSTPSDQGGSDAHDDDDHSFIDEHVRNGYNINEIKEKLKSAGFKNVVVRYSYGPAGKIAWKLTMKYPISLMNISKVFLMILPFYFILCFPFILFLSYADLHTRYSSGTGLIVKAWKSGKKDE